MTFKILGLLVAIAAFGTAPSFASDDASVSPGDSQMEMMNPEAAPPRCAPWMRNCRRPQPRRMVCYARNITGRTFAAYGTSRSSRAFVQQHAVQACRRGSAFVIGRTCRAVGCRLY
jgi:hypothetical protein